MPKTKLQVHIDGITTQWPKTER